MFRLMRYGTATAVCASLVAAIAWLGLIGQSATIAFADVQTEIQKTQSVQYVETWLRPPDAKPGKVAEPKMLRVAGDQYQPRRHLVLGRHLHRTEAFDSEGQIAYVQIYDMKTGKSLILYPKERRAITGTIEFTLDRKTNEVPRPERDLYAKFREIPAEATTKLPARTIDGTQVAGFVWERKTDATDTWTRTYWVNPETKLPVRIEFSYRSTDKRIATADWVQSDFVFDADLAPALFSTEVPEGYEVETQKISRPRK